MDKLTNYIPKQLIYYFTCDTWEFYEVYKLHLECIKSYGNIFFKYTFILGFNDLNDTEFIEYWKNTINEYIDASNKNIEYIIEQNNPLFREGIHYYNYIYKHLNDFDGLLCWGHSKRDFKYPKDNIYKWISFSHYIMSSNIPDVENKLMYDKYLYIGPNLGFNPFNANENYEYLGSFYWMNPKKIYNYYQNEINTFINYIDSYLDNRQAFFDYINDPEYDLNTDDILYYIAEHNNTLIDLNYLYHYQYNLVDVFAIRSKNVDCERLMCKHDFYDGDALTYIIIIY